MMFKIGSYDDSLRLVAEVSMTDFEYGSLPPGRRIAYMIGTALLAYATGKEDEACYPGKNFPYKTLLAAVRTLCEAEALSGPE